MPRNATGTYSLPVASYVAGTTIRSADMNSNLSDIATALTQSVASTGVTPMTGPLQASNGAVGSPSLSFASSPTTGFYLAGVNQIGIVTAGVLAATINSNQTTSWAGNAAFAAGVTVGTTLGVTGAATLSSTLNVTGAAVLAASLTVGTTLGVTGKASFTSTDSMAMAKGTTAQRNGGPTAGDVRYNSTLNCLEYWNGTIWILTAAPTTVQKFTSGSGNYTPTAGVARIKVRMVGGGGGGSAQSTNAGSNGVDSSFGTWTAIKGTGAAVGASGGVGGTGGVNGTGTLVVRFDGGKGYGSCGSGLATSGCIMQYGGGAGGVNPFGGAGSAQSGLAGSNAAANTGAGGGGASGGTASGGGSSGGVGGGGAGEYVEFWVDAPGVIAYVVGGGGNGGAAGGLAGGNGAAGVIIIEEFYS